MGWGGGKLNPVKLFFHSLWVWHRAPTTHARCEISCSKCKPDGTGLQRRECLEFNPLSRVRVAARPLQPPPPRCSETRRSSCTQHLPAPTRGGGEMDSERNEAQLLHAPNWLQVMCSSSFVFIVPDMDIKISLSVKRRAKRTKVSRCDSTKASVPPKSGCGHAVSTSGHVLTDTHDSCSEDRGHLCIISVSFCRFVVGINIFEWANSREARADPVEQVNHPVSTLSP